MDQPEDEADTRDRQESSIKADRDAELKREEDLRYPESEREL